MRRCWLEIWFQFLLVELFMLYVVLLGLKIMIGRALNRLLSSKRRSELSIEEFEEEKLIRAKRWIIKWGVGFTLVIVVLWPILTLPAGQFNKGYFRFWAVIAIVWGTIASVVIIALPLMESWETIQIVMLEMFTNDRMLEKIEELNLKLQTIVSLLPDAEKMYLLEKEKVKKEASELEMQIVPE